MGFEADLFLAPFASHLHDITKVLWFCAEHGIGKFKLSNLPISASVSARSAGQIPRPADLFEIAEDLRSVASAVRDKVSLEIHDRFLWELLDQGSANLSEYGGCQAGNSIAHVDERGVMYPCSSWPAPLGSLLKASVEEIWASPERRSLRKCVAKTPSGCRGCSDYQVCYAGCRGLSATFDFSNQGRDPLCDGRR